MDIVLGVSMSTPNDPHGARMSAARLDGIAGPFKNHLKLLCQQPLTCDEPPRMF
jgi:hypothetical protein